VARLFIAVWPTRGIIDTLSALPRIDQPGVRWTTAEQWHVTLRYFGKVEESAAVAALESVSATPAVATVGPSVQRLGDDVVIAPIEGLDPLADAVRTATADVGEPVDPRPFRGHLTLARPRRGGECTLEGHPIEAEFRVDELALVRSVLHSAGATYVIVTTKHLTA
jgi:2'-5' RNA ligase